MKRIQFHRYGGPEEMRLEECQLPEPADDQILVKVKAASINPVDWSIRRGKMRMMTGRRFPRGMGQDFSGVVEQTGKGVRRFKAGDEVFGSTPLKTSGSFAEWLVTSETLAIAKPPMLSHEEAATLPVAASTAWVALVEKAGLKAGQSVFINGAYGAVGQATTQIAKALGAHVVGRVGGDCMEDAKAIGADVVLDYRHAIDPTMFGKFDVVFDTHGSLTIKEERQLAKRGGLILDINPSFSKLLLSVLVPSRKFVMGKQDEATFARVVDFAVRQKLKIAIGRIVTLDEGIELIRQLEAGGRVRGKGLIVMEEPSLAVMP